MIIDELVIWRTAAHVQRRIQLGSIAWQDMTPAEQDEFYNGVYDEQLFDVTGEPLFDISGEPLIVAGNTPRRLGAYDYADLNRVESAVAYLSTLLVTLGYDASCVTKADWVESDIPTPAEYARYIGNIARLRAVLELSATTPTTPATMRYLTYGAANDIEQILRDVYQAIRRMTTSFFYSGEIYAGEV